MRLTATEVASILTLWDEDKVLRGGLVRVNGRDVPPARSHRDCHVCPVPTPDWLGERLEMNLAATLSIIRYRKGHHIGWHRDNLPGRKANVIVGLSNGYQGGRLETRTASWVLGPGDVAVIPIDVEHRVTKVTSGERWTAVTWEVE